MDGWDKVFTAGRHKDAHGNQREWTTEDLDRIVASFNPTFHEPPLVIGHPSDNAPAFGWIAGIKRSGNDLFVKYRDVATEFKEWAGKRLFKKKSIAVYPDGSLRHVGYLGAAPPAIKGLPDYQFRDAKGEAITWEFGDCEDLALAGIMRRLREWFIAKFGIDEADRVLSNDDVICLEQDIRCDSGNDNLGNCPQDLEDEMKPEEVQAMINTQTAQFSEQLKTLTTENTALKTRLETLEKNTAAERDQALQREFSEFLATPDLQKRVPEGSRAATIAQMVLLAAAAPVEFSEADGSKKSVPALDVYKAQLKALPPVVEFSEVAGKERAGARKEETVTRKEFSAWDAKKQLEFACSGGTVID